MLEATVSDVRIAVRLLRKSPVFTLTAALSVAIGIGANTAIFSLVNALLFKGRPGISQPQELVDVGRTRRGSGFDTSSYPNYLDLKRRVTALRDLAAYRVEPIAMSLRDAVAGDSEPERIFITSVTGNYFNVLGAPPAAGRLFGETEDARARVQPTVVLSHALWERKYRRDPALVGRTVSINGIDTRVVGIAPAGFRGSNFLAPDAWMPVGAFPVFNPSRGDQMLTERRIVWLVLVGRLKPGAGLAEAQSQLSTVARQLAADYPDSNRDMSWTVSLSTLVPAPFRGMVNGFLGLLMTIVGLVLLIACINLAGVLLARGAGRRKEVALRLAVGAGRGRIVRQLVTETLAIFAIGGAGGVLLAYWLAGLLASLTQALPVPVVLDLSPDFPVLMFAGAATLISGILSGLVPALQAARTDLTSGLKDEASGYTWRRLRLRGALLVGQVALSCLLFLAAALFARSLQAAGNINPGFDANGVDVVTLDMAMSGHRGAAATQFGDRLIERVRQIPGVTSAALTRMIPLQGGGMGLGALAPVGGDARESINADWNIVTPDYFRTLRIPVLEGRGFIASDRDGAPAVAIVNETFAKTAWPGSSAVGQRLIHSTPDSRSELHVIGVVRDGKYRSLGEAPLSHIFVPHAQQFSQDMSLVVRRTMERSAVPAIREALRELDPDLPIISAQSLAEAVAIGLMPQRLAATLAGSLGGVGLLLAAIGIYGVTSFTVAHRRREIGLRIALGAAQPQVLGLVLRQGMGLAVAGVVIGLALGAVAARLLTSLLYGLGANDPVTFVSVAGIFCSIAALATYLPARAALRIDPLKALRVD